MIPPASGRFTIKSFSGLRTKQLEDGSCSQRNLAKEAKLSQQERLGRTQHHDIIDSCFFGVAGRCAASASCQTQSHDRASSTAATTCHAGRSGRSLLSPTTAVGANTVLGPSHLRARKPSASKALAKGRSGKIGGCPVPNTGYSSAARTRPSALRAEVEEGRLVSPGL